jgi:hypothetical protein
LLTAPSVELVATNVELTLLNPELTAVTVALNADNPAPLAATAELTALKLFDIDVTLDTAVLNELLTLVNPLLKLLI